MLYSVCVYRFTQSGTAAVIFLLRKRFNYLEVCMFVNFVDHEDN